MQRQVGKPSGFSALYLLVTMVAFCGFCSFGVDLGRVHLVKAQLQDAADAAARAAASAVPGDLAAARARAAQFAAYHRADGTPVVIDPARDVEFGRWDASTRQFERLSGSALAGANAVRVTARRTEATGDATPLVFAAVLGVESCDATARAVARVEPPAHAMNIVGLNFVRLSGSDRIDSYDSAAGPYSPGAAGDDVRVASNGNVSVGGSSAIDGSVFTGESGTASGRITGTRAALDAPLSYPPATLPGTYTSHGAIALTAGQSKTLSAGNHYVTSLSMSGNAELHVSGPVKLYVQGAFTIDGNASIAVAGDRPANLEISVLGAGPINLGKNNLFATIYAPQSPLSMNGNSDLFGAVIAASITMNGSNTIHFDTALPRPPAGPQKIALVK
jgi:hypothetical protein